MRETKKALMAGILGMGLFLGSISGEWNSQTVYAEEQKSCDINLGTAVLGGGEQDVFYLGSGGKAALDWKVLKMNQNASGDPMALVMSNCGLLMGEDSITQQTMAWSQDGNTNPEQENYFDWSGSDMEKWLNGAEFYGNPARFTSVEQSMLLPIDSYQGDETMSILNDYFYLPYSAEMQNADYGFTDDASRQLAVTAPYWLRDRGSIYSGSEVGGITNATAKLIDENGTLIETTNTTVKKDGTAYAVVPMANLSMGNVIFTKTFLGTWNDTFRAPVDVDSHNWELTLADPGQTITPICESIKVDGITAEDYPKLKAGQKIEGIYQYHCDQNDSYQANVVSVLITKGDDKSGSIVSYAQFPMSLDEVGKGTLSFTIPAEYNQAEDQIYILAERVENPSSNLPAQITSNDAAVEASVEYASAPVLLLEQTASPKANPAPNTDQTAFAKEQTITLTSETPGADIYYTTDGTDPVVDEALRYEKPFLISKDTVVKAMAIADNHFESEIVTWNYLIGVTNITKVELSPTSGEMARGDLLTFIAAVTGEHIRDEGVTWTLTGNTSKDTKLVQGIGKTAILHTAENENPGKLTVRVTSKADPTKFAEAVITVSDKYVVTVEAVSNGTVYVNKTRAQAGTQIVIGAEPNSGYHLQNILVDGNVISGNTFQMPAKGVTVGAEFAEGGSGGVGGSGSGSSGGSSGGASGGTGSGSSGSAGSSGSSSLASSRPISSSGTLASAKNPVSTSVSAAKTSDTTNLTGYGLLLITAAFCTGIIVRKKKN